MFTYILESINEEAARLAKEMNSFSDYKPGYATEQFKSQMEALVEEAEKMVSRSRFIEAEPERITEAQSYINYYGRKYAEYINRDNEISCRCPSVMIAGPANFPVRKKQKQIAAWDANRKNYISLDDACYKLRYILLQEHPVNGSDPDAIEKLEKKLARLETEHAEHLKSNRDAAKLVKEGKARFQYEFFGDVITEDGRTIRRYFTDNESAEIRRVKDRVESLKKQKENPIEETSGDDWRFYEDTEAGRICFEFNGKPEQAIIDTLKSNGFKWSPKNTRWQRQTTDNARRAADRIKETLTA